MCDPSQLTALLKPSNFDIKMASARVSMMMDSRPDHEVISIDPSKEFDWDPDRKSLLQKLAKYDEAASTISTISTEDFDKFNEKPVYLTWQSVPGSEGCIRPRVNPVPLRPYSGKLG